MDHRLPAHVEVASLIRLTESQGGFAAVLAKGEREVGTLLLVLTENGENTRVYERMPEASGPRKWRCAKYQDAENKEEFVEYLERRKYQDPDVWIVELDIAHGERLIGL